MDLPETLLYTRDHEWIKIDGKTATVGITDFAQGELGDIVFVDINTIGSVVSEGDVFGSIEAVKTVADLFMPVAGKVIQINPGLERSPEKINKDPYGEGWIVKIEVEGGDSAGLLDSKKYAELIAR